MANVACEFQSWVLGCFLWANVFTLLTSFKWFFNLGICLKATWDENEDHSPVLIPNFILILWSWIIFIYYSHYVNKFVVDGLISQNLIDFVHGLCTASVLPSLSVSNVDGSGDITDAKIHKGWLTSPLHRFLNCHGSNGFTEIPI